MDLVTTNQTSQIKTELEADLLALCSYGKPRISHLGDGWHASLEMHVASEGAEFKVSSDFGMRSPSEAMNQLKDRLNESLNKLNGA